jgi:uncharacterized protein YecE (DUF72 family)
MSRYYLGTQGWSYPAWAGSFYPPGTSSKAYLPYYATQFNTVELDTTFYAVPRETTIAGWRQKTPPGFRFSAKFPQAVTHEKGLVNCKEDATGFVEAMAALDDKLGVLLLQMPPNWGAQSIGELETFLAGLPIGTRYALEIRHKSWLSTDAFPKLCSLLEKHAVALTLVQHAWMPHLDTVTAPHVYIRWLGRRQDIPDDDFSKIRINRDVHLDRWAPQVMAYVRSGLNVYGYFNNHYQGHSPASVRDFQARLAALDPELSATAPPPPNIAESPTLFDLGD